MNAAEKLAALEALLARVQRNAAERRGEDGVAASLQPEEPRHEEPKRPAPVARRSERPADGARLQRILEKAWDTWGDDPEGRQPETLGELLGQPVLRGPKAAEPADGAPATATPVALPPARDEPELMSTRILAPELEEALLQASTEPPPPPIAPPRQAPMASILPPPEAPLASILPPPLSSAPPVSSTPDSLGRAAGSRRRLRSRRWFVFPRTASRRTATGIAWRQLGAALLVAVPLVSGVVYLVRRDGTTANAPAPAGAPPTAMSRLDAANGQVALSPGDAPGGPGDAGARETHTEARTGEGAALAPDRGYVIVATTEPAHAYFNGVLAGETNVPLEVACGWRNLRLASPGMPGPGQSYPIWMGDGRPVLIACRGTTTLDMSSR